MEKIRFHLVLHVRDLQKCRIFYQENLQLGAPVIDSPFRVEFQVSDSGTICLEAVRGSNELPPPPNLLEPTWMLETGDETLPELLTTAGFLRKDIPETDLCGYPVQTFQDPEGHLFRVVVTKE